MEHPIFSAILRRDATEVAALASDPANLVVREDYLANPMFQRMTPLMVATMMPGDMAEIVKLLLDAGANPNECASGSPGPVYYAAGGPWYAGEFWDYEFESDYAERLSLVLAAGGDPNAMVTLGASEYEGTTPICEAASSGDPARVRCLLQYGASPHPPADMAVTGYDRWKGLSEDYVAHRKSSIPPCATDYPADVMPLFKAVVGGSVECVDLLLEAGADPLIRCEDGLTVLDNYNYTSPEVVRRLIQAGIDVNDWRRWWSFANAGSTPSA